MGIDLIEGIGISLFGPFSVTDRKGKDLTPTSQKAQGLLALLATSKGYQRSRQWLQSKLWSDRGQAQSAGSLRQALLQIRKALGPEFSHILVAERQRVFLKAEFLTVDETTGQEFMEGADVRDPAFEEWLREQRQANMGELDVQIAASASSARPRQRGIVIRTSHGGSEQATWLSQLICDTAARHIREFFSVELLVNPPESNALPSMTIDIDGFAFARDTIGLRISFGDRMAGRQLWSGNVTLDLNTVSPTKSPKVLRLLNELVQGIGDARLSASTPDLDDPDQLCRQAVRSLFTMRKDEVAKAEALLNRAFEIDPRGLHLAWLGQLKAIQLVERHVNNTEAVREEGERLIERALELESGNSMVLATVANTLSQLLKQNERGKFFARESVRRNPANPMAWWSLSMVNMYSGDARLSYQSALTAQKLAQMLPNKFWWDTQVFAPALLLGKLDIAKKNAESAFAWNPNFRPSLRYLIALYANEGDEERAVQIVEQLKVLEDDFSVERLIVDHDYPASLLHRTPGLDLNRVRALA